MKNYSVIISHKDIPELLQRCLNSIPQREDIEVIIIDDGSKAVPVLTREDAELVALSENGGAGHARNIGLQHAKGNWVLFIDADDFFLPDAFRYLECEKEICLFYPKRFYSDNLESAKILYPRNHFMEYFFCNTCKKNKRKFGLYKQ